MVGGKQVASKTYGECIQSVEVPLRAEATTLPEAQGRAAWAWLHAEAGKEALTVERLTGEFMPMIPSYGCSCKKEWQEILAKNPLPATGQAQWAVDRHNDINVKLGKPLWPYGVDKDE